MPGKHVNRSAIAEVVEPVLDDHFPAESSKFPDDELDDGCVRPVDQAIDVARVPLGIDEDRDIEDLRDLVDLANRHAVQLRQLSARDDGLAHARGHRDVDLAQALVQPYRPEHAPDATSVHLAIVTECPCLALI